MVKIFSIFQFEFSGYSTEFKISSPIVGCCQASPKGCEYGLHLRILKFRDFFQKFSENLNSSIICQTCPNPVVGYCQITLKDCESCLQM